MNFCQLTTAVTAIANKLTIEEISLLAAVFVQLGDTLATIVTQRTICATKEEKTE